MSFFQFWAFQDSRCRLKSGPKRSRFWDHRKIIQKYSRIDFLRCMLGAFSHPNAPSPARPWPEAHWFVTGSRSFSVGSYGFPITYGTWLSTGSCGNLAPCGAPSSTEFCASMTCLVISHRILWKSHTLSEIISHRISRSCQLIFWRILWKSNTLWGTMFHKIRATGPSAAGGSYGNFIPYGRSFSIGSRGAIRSCPGGSHGNFTERMRSDAI